MLPASSFKCHRDGGFLCVGHIMRMLVTGTEAIPKSAWTMTLFRRASRQVCGICAAFLILVLSNLLLGFFSGFQFALTRVSDDIKVDIIPSDTPDRPSRLRAPGRHVYLPNGLLQVNQDAPHPIYELMEQAEKDWNRKLGRASATLEQAVREYRRRYHRYPPKGFDLW